MRQSPVRWMQHAMARMRSLVGGNQCLAVPWRREFQQSFFLYVSPRFGVHCHGTNATPMRVREYVSKGQFQSDAREAAADRQNEDVVVLDGFLAVLDC
jgi:hypothetical protein